MPFEKGNVINLGRKLSKETRLKMSLAHKGSKPSRWGAGFRKGSVPWNKGTNFQRNAYFAGLFDGEGSVFITYNTNKKGKYKKVCVTIGMRADKAHALPEGQKIWGGSLHERMPRKSFANKALYWHLYQRSAEKLLLSIKPFLRIKARQVELALRYRWLQTKRKLPDGSISNKEWEERKKIELEIKSLNH